MSTLISLFEKNVSKNPLNIALVDWESEISYYNLNILVNKCANILTEFIVPGDRICLCLSENPSNIIISILAVLKTGCTYIPLDQKNPEERMRYLLQSSEPKIIIGDKNSPDFIKNYCKFLTVDNLIDSQVPSVYTTVKTHGNAPAYIIFTSGSTWMPKGVAVSHENLVNAYFSWEMVYTLNKIKCHLQVASYAFDVFSGDWIRSLCSGGKLVMCPEATLKNPEQLYNVIERHKIECAEFLPVLLRDLFSYLAETKQKLTTVKILICGSDTWYVSEYLNFKKFLPHEGRLISSYGTSETTIDTSYFEFTQKNSFLQSETIQVPIGKAFPGMKIILINDDLKETKHGEIGEIFIGWSWVSLGYINADDLNREKFIRIDNEIYFRTGDYGKMLSTGDIEFLGRRDNQVKVRGKRISLAEIENALISNFPITDSAVLLLMHNGNEKIVAFVTSKHQQSEDIEGMIKRGIGAFLPQKMLPDMLILVPKLPTNLNGKIDKSILQINFINKVYE